MANKELTKAHAHATAFYKAGGTVDHYKEQHRKNWQTLACEGMLHKVFHKRAPRIYISKSYSLVPKSPTKPQNWMTPLNDLLKERL